MECLVLSIICSLFLLGGAQRASAEPPPVRIGYFANITHAQALVGKANGTFEKRMGVKIDWKGFNAGPTAMEALLSGALDIAYVGPNPAVNAYLRSGGKALRVISGACSGGAALVVHRESGVTRPADLKGKRVASPELGNTQDVALRHWLATQGLKPNRDVKVLPVKNSEIMLLFQQKQIAAAWVPEPWVSRLVAEAGGTIMVDERSLWPEGRFTTAVVVVSGAFLVGLLGTFDADYKKAVKVGRLIILWGVSVYLLVAHSGDVVRVVKKISGGIESAKQGSEEKGKKAAQAVKDWSRLPGPAEHPPTEGAAPETEHKE